MDWGDYTVDCEVTERTGEFQGGLRVTEWTVGLQSGLGNYRVDWGLLLSNQRLLYCAQTEHKYEGVSKHKRE